MYYQILKTPDIYKYFYSLVKQIPEGKISTYKIVAEALGDPRAARAVGQLLKKNPNPIIVPCHRVVMSNGTPGGYAGPHTAKKLSLLRNEGVFCANGKIVNFQNKIFRDFHTDFPLRQLRMEQKYISKQIKIPKSSGMKYKTILGLDISYKNRKIRAAGVLLENGKIIHRTIYTGVVNFPYISTYLSYRELPFFIKILEKLTNEGKIPDLIMTDGNGILHPRRCGIASHLNFVTGIPAVGVAKSRLCGKIGKFGSLNKFQFDGKIKHACAAPLEYMGELRGYAYIYDTGKLKNPVYVSPGGGISFRDALRIVTFNSKTKIPEPIKAAHKFAGKWQ